MMGRHSDQRPLLAMVPRRTLAILLFHTALSRAFVPASTFLPSTCSGTCSPALGLFTDGQGEVPRNPTTKVPIVTPTNEWGIPDSKSLPPLSDDIVEALPNGGRITLVGSGPGDPDLLTMSAYRLLTTTPNALIVCDRLVSPEIVALCQGEIKIARKLPGCAELAQEEIYSWCHKGLREGKHVIRLKIGDPFVFGRGGEEILTLRRYGLEPKVIPGVSAAFSAPLLGSIPVTHRGVANQVVMCTGYGREGTSPDLIQYHKEQTVVFLMAVGRLAELSDRLQRLAGYPADTPVGIIERAGCPSQRTIVGDLTTIAQLADQHQVQAPSTIVVGNVVRVLLSEESIQDGIVVAQKAAEMVVDATGE